MYNRKDIVCWEGIMAIRENFYEKMDALDPIEYLSQYSGGEPLKKQLVQLVYDLKKKYSFKNGVINAIFEICLRENNYKIVRSDILSLADEFYRAGIMTSEEAFQYIQEEEMEYDDDFDELDFNYEYVETSIALIARQLHQLRKEVNEKFKQLHQQLDQIEYQLEQIHERIRS
jgi:hypothetical protein